MNPGSHTLRTVGDFASVPPVQLSECLSAFRQWLELRQQAAAAAVDGEFIWQPVRGPVVNHSARLRRDTPIEDLSLRASVLAQLRRMHVLTLEDFAEISADELQRLNNVGQSTVSRVGALLNELGLQFKAPPPRTAGVPTGREAASAGAEAASGDQMPLAHAGVSPVPLKILMALNVHTIGALRAMTLSQLEAALTLRWRYQVFRLLHARGLNLADQPSQLQLWRAGLLRLDEMVKPGDDEPVAALSPWLGSAARVLERARVRNVGGVRRLAGGPLARWKCQQLTAHSWVRARKYFGLPTRQETESNRVH